MDGLLRLLEIVLTITLGESKTFFFSKAQKYKQKLCFKNESNFSVISKIMMNFTRRDKGYES